LTRPVGEYLRRWNRTRGDEERSLFHPRQPDGWACGLASDVVVFRDGKIVGGDAYTTPVLRHTSSKNAVGIGLSDTLTDKNAIMKGTALVGSSSQLFDATLRKLCGN